MNADCVYRIENNNKINNLNDAVGWLLCQYEHSDAQMQLIEFSANFRYTQTSARGKSLASAQNGISLMGPSLSNADADIIIIIIVQF